MVVIVLWVFLLFMAFATHLAPFWQVQKMKIISSCKSKKWTWKKSWKFCLVFFFQGFYFLALRTPKTKKTLLEKKNHFLHLQKNKFYLLLLLFSRGPFFDLVSPQYQKMNSLNSKEAFSFTFKEFILWSRKSSTSNIQKWTSFFFSIYFLNLQENILLLLLLFSRS